MTMEEQQKIAATQLLKSKCQRSRFDSPCTEQVAALSVKTPASVVCFRCQQPGHIQLNCPLNRRCYICGQAGHIAKQCLSGNGQGMPQKKLY